MALKDWMEAITFRCRLSGSTMHSDTAKSSSTRNLPVTWGRVRCWAGATWGSPGVPAQRRDLSPPVPAGLRASHKRVQTPDTREGPYLKPEQRSKEVGPQVTDDDIEGDAGPQHQPNHAAREEAKRAVNGILQGSVVSPWSEPPSAEDRARAVFTVQPLLTRHPKTGLRERCNSAHTQDLGASVQRRVRVE